MKNECEMRHEPEFMNMRPIYLTREQWSWVLGELRDPSSAPTATRAIVIGKIDDQLIWQDRYLVEKEENDE